jgi:GDP-4-dehydro-6-deoxy-D-mannose reductase
MSKRYLITGVAGFVGRYFVEYLQQYEPDAEIYGVDIVPQTDMPISYQSMDLTDTAAVETMIAAIRPDYIVHLAGISSVGQSWQEPKYCFENNTSVMFNLLTALHQNHCQTRVLSVGSSEEYGSYDAKQMPLTETTPLLPQNPYAVAKVSQELIGQLFNRAYEGIDVIMTRSFNHIGPRQNPRFVIPSFVRQLVAVKEGKLAEITVGNIEVARDFSDVRDVVSAYYLLLQKGLRGEVYNVCSGHSHRLKDIITKIENILNISASIKVDQTLLRPNDQADIFGDHAKLVSLGWKPKYTLTATLKDMVKEYIHD